MRPIWAGSLSFGLVNIHVKLYLAEKTERVSFRMLHAKDHAPVQFRRFCSAEEREIPYEEIVRGYEYEKGTFVVIEDADFDRIERAAARTVDIQQFVERSELSPMLIDTPYFLEPAKGAERAYALLRAALRRSGKVGIARVVLKEREYVAAVHVEGSALTMSTLRYAAEVRDAGELNIPSEETSLPERQVELALMLVDQLTSEFQASAFRDDYHERVAEMIRQKLDGLPTPARGPVQEGPAQVVDLAEILERSLSKTPGAAAARNKGARRAPRQAAARAGSRRKK
jgi:DNA end-binding protein Ku